MCRVEVGHGAVNKMEDEWRQGRSDQKASEEELTGVLLVLLE